MALNGARFDVGRKVRILGRVSISKELHSDSADYRQTPVRVSRSEFAFDSTTDRRRWVR